MAIHSGILAWEIPWTEESGELQSMGSQRVRHDGMTKYSTGGREWGCFSDQMSLCSGALGP